MQSSKPPVYFCEAGSTAVRLALSAPPAPVKGQKTWVQGSPLKGDLKKPIIAIATLPSDPYFLLLLTADGLLSGYATHRLHACLEQALRSHRSQSYAMVHIMNHYVIGKLLEAHCLN